MDRKGFLEALDKEGMLIYGTTYESNFKRLQALKKHRDTEDSIAKSLKLLLNVYSNKLKWQEKL